MLPMTMKINYTCTCQTLTGTYVDVYLLLLLIGHVLLASCYEEVLYHMREYNIGQDNHNPLDILYTLKDCFMP